MAALVANLCVCGAFATPILGREGNKGSAMAAILLSNASDAQVNRGAKVGQNLGKKRSTDVSQILTRSRRGIHGDVVRKGNRVDIVSRLSIMHEHDRQIAER